jgi:hypothetical protein
MVFSVTLLLGFGTPSRSPKQSRGNEEQDESFHSPSEGATNTPSQATNTPSQGSSIEGDPLLKRVLNNARLKKAEDFLTAERSKGQDTQWYDERLANLQDFVDENKKDLDKLMAADAGINENNMDEEEENSRKRRM